MIQVLINNQLAVLLIKDINLYNKIARKHHLNKIFKKAKNLTNMAKKARKIKKLQIWC